MAVVQSDLRDVVMYDGCGGGIDRMGLTISRGGGGGGGGIDWVNEVAAGRLWLQGHAIHLACYACFS